MVKCVSNKTALIIADKKDPPEVSDEARRYKPRPANTNNRETNKRDFVIVLIEIFSDKNLYEANVIIKSRRVSLLPCTNIEKSTMQLTMSIHFEIRDTFITWDAHNIEKIAISPDEEIKTSLIPFSALPEKIAIYGVRKKAI